MYNLPEDYMRAATSKTRKISIWLRTIIIDLSPDHVGSWVERNEYYDGDGIISLKIVQGQTNGGFTIGNTVCAALTATLTNNVKLIIPGKHTDCAIGVFVRFIDGETPTEWRLLGEFFVNSIKKGLYNQTVTAYDRINRFDKNWVLPLGFPAKISDVLKNILPNDTFTLINDAVINTKPIYDFTAEGEEIPYTEREILGFTASLNGGNFCVDSDGIRLATPQRAYYTIPYDGVISQSAEGITYTVTSVQWTGSGMQMNLDPDYKAGTVEFSNPLDIDNPVAVLTNLNRKLKGLTYDAITIKKQGTNFFQLGDIVNYIAYDGTMYTLLIQGIVYELSSNGFTETLYSPAKSNYAESYAGRQTTTSGGGIIIMGEPETFCDVNAIPAIESDDCYCEKIEF